MSQDASIDPAISEKDIPELQSAWKPTTEEESRTFELFKGFTYSERNNETTSWIWQYGLDIQSRTERKWVCMPCVRKKDPRPTSYEYKGTQNAETHLWKVHGHWDPSGKRQAPSAKKGEKHQFDSISDLLSLNRNSSKEQAIANCLIKRFDRGRFQQMVANLIIEDNLPFRLTELPRLRAIFEYLNPSVGITNAHVSGKTIRALAVRQFEVHKSKVVEALKASPGQVHIAFDGARTRNRHCLYGITAAYRDQLERPQKLVLGLPELVKRHSGENIAAEIVEVIKSFELEEKVGYFTLDNAGNNDTAMEVIAEVLGLDSTRRRVRCIGHIINLVVKALLFGKDAEAFEETIERGELLARAAHDEWMKKGPVGKVHNWVVWVHRSDLLTNMLKELQQDSINTSDDPEVQKQKPLEVILDNDTRWLSQYYMIKRAIKLRRFYDEFMAKAKRVFQDAGKGQRGAKLSPCLETTSILDEKDWAVLEAFEGLLHDFHVVIKALQGDGKPRERRGGIEETFGSITRVLEAFEFLLKKLEAAKSLIHEYPEPVQFGININLGWAKLDKYYNYLSDSPVYYAAAALTPCLRWRFFENQWGDEHADWIDDAKELVRSLWESEYRDLEVSTTSEDVRVAKKRKTNLSSFDLFCQANRGIESPQPRPSPAPSSQPTMDEYDRWLLDVSVNDKEVTDPLEYWRSKAKDYPRLSKMALDVMTVPAMSAECERLFSAVGLMITAIRNRLDASTVGLVQILRSWLKAGIIDRLEDVLLDDGLLGATIDG
jgi:hypothetical protein